MIDKFIVQGEITEEGQLIVQLPPDIPRGSVQVTIEQTHITIEIENIDEELETLIEESVKGSDLTMGEIELPDGKTYVEQIRDKRRYT